MSTDIVRTEYDKQYYPQIREILNAKNAPDGVVGTALEYCKAAGLDIMRKPVAIISFGGKNEIVFTIQAITTIASRAGWAGSDEIVFSENMVSVGGKTVPEWGYQVVYKMMGRQRVPFTGPKVYVQERYKNSWSQAGVMAMFQKCVLSAALRIAFPEALAHAYTEEEMEYTAVEAVDNSGIEALKTGGLKKLVREQPEVFEAEAIYEPTKNSNHQPVTAPNPISFTEVEEEEEPPAPSINLVDDAIDALNACETFEQLIELKDSIKKDWGLTPKEMMAIAPEFARVQREKFGKGGSNA